MMYSIDELIGRFTKSCFNKGGEVPKTMFHDGGEGRETMTEIDLQQIGLALPSEMECPM